ncbi:MAG: ribokinase [Magnetospirillum sp.]|nr:ribokinase [Magnetospirillum sp.]
MIPALLASVGLPLLSKAIGAALGSIDHPVARIAVDALSGVDAALRSQAISPEQVAAANRRIERLAELDSEDYRQTLAQVNATFRAEVRSDDAYVRRWRPTFGYAVAATWSATMGAMAWAVVAAPAQAPTIIAAMVNTAPIWGIALAVLGISVVKRSQDKAAGC